MVVPRAKQVERRQLVCHQCELNLLVQDLRGPLDLSQRLAGRHHAVAQVQLPRTLHLVAQIAAEPRVQLGGTNDVAVVVIQFRKGVPQNLLLAYKAVSLHARHEALTIEGEVLLPRLRFGGQ